MGGGDGGDAVFDAQYGQPAPAQPAPFDGVRRPTKRYNALGILEDVPPDGPVAGMPQGVMDVGPSEAPETAPAARREPTVVGAGPVRSLGGSSAANGMPQEWASVGRNADCPCGSGRKFKRCHGKNI